MYFKNKLGYSKGSDHVTDDIVPLFWSLQKLSRKNIIFLQIFTAVW